ncbi:MAG TPA: hypothetical protein VK524_20595, partial [Polyangiaceae bacterium]|nr:hypothetical protein [Polyangiaceae bacterium]
CVPDNPATPSNEDELRFNRPLCNPLNGGPAQATQLFAKAYPGLRQLQVLKDFGQITTNSIVASICPKHPDPSKVNDQRYYGYTPAVSAIIDRLKEAFGGKCLSRQLDVSSGEIPCKIVETTRIQGQTCGANSAPPDGCPEANGRATVSEKLAAAVREQLRRSARACGGEGLPPCNEYCMCEIQALEGADAEQCQTLPDDSAVQSLPNPGYCYVDPLDPPAGQNIGSLEAIAACKETEPRRLRFAGADTPVNGSITFIACVGQTGTAAPAPTGDGGS